MQPPNETHGMRPKQLWRTWEPGNQLHLVLSNYVTVIFCWVQCITWEAHSSSVAARSTVEKASRFKGQGNGRRKSGCNSCGIN